MKIIKVVAVALIENQKLLVALRSPTMSSPNLWELPGGKVEEGESDQAALVRECQEELHITVAVGDFLADSEVQVGSRIIQMKVYRAVIQSGILKKTEHAELRWIEKHEIDELPWAPADVDILPALMAIL